jgi:hypothetical protein
LRNARIRSSPCTLPNIVPFGPLGAGQWTGHPVGLFIAATFVLIALIGIPELRFLLPISLALGVIFGFILRLWHRSRSYF